MYGFFVLAALGLMTVGLINPRILFPKMQNPTRKHAFFMTFTVFVLAFGIWASRLPSAEKATAPAVAETAKLVASQGIGVQQAEIVALFDQLGFAQKPSDLPSGEPRMIGKAKGAVSEVTGSGAAVTSASITAFMGNEESANMAAVMQMSALVGTVFPGWTEWFPWFQSAVGRAGDTLAKDGKLITVSVKREIGMVQVIIKPADHQ